jgi:hypothetical protein
MYENTALGGYDGLGKSWDEASPKDLHRVVQHIMKNSAQPKLPATVPVDAKSVILGKDKTISSMTAYKNLLKRKRFRKGGQDQEKLKTMNIYWNANGPIADTRQTKAEVTPTTVPPLKKSKKVETKIVRDLPVAKLPPAPSGSPPPPPPLASEASPSMLGSFGEALPGKWTTILVLGLLLFILSRYNRS